MSKIDNFRFNLKTVDEVYSNVVVFNRKYIPYYIWVKFPICMRCSKVVQIDCISSNQSQIQLAGIEYENCWAKIPYTSLDISIGQHTYKFSVLDNNLNCIQDFYFSYIVQSDNPKKVYNYMDNDECNCSVCK